MRVDLPAYLPDQSLNSGALIEAQNVYPAIDGYRPFRGFLSASNTLPAAFRGGASFISQAGTSYLLVGTATGLVRYSSGPWTSLLSGLTIGERWRFAQFGNVALAVTGGTTYAVDLNAGTAAALAGSPSGTSIAIVGDHVVIGGASGSILEVRWSAFNDHTGWTAGVNQSGFQPMLTGGEVMGVAGGEYGVILQRERLVRMDRTGDSSAPFVFNEISPNIGCASKGSIGQYGNNLFFLSDRGFMMVTAGQEPRPIGSEKVDRTFIKEIPRDEWARLYCAVDPQNTIVMWMLPGTPGCMWVYNWSIDKWATASFRCEGLFSGYTSSTDLDALGWANIDAQPFFVDDPRFSGGAPRLFVAQDGAVGTLAGATLPVTLWLGFLSLAGDNVARVRGFYPIGDMRNAACVMDARQRLGDVESLTASGPLRASGLMPIRTAGRFISTRLTIPAGEQWSYVRAFQYEFERGGLR